MRDHVQRQLDIVELAGLQGGWLFHRFAASQIERVVAYQPGFSFRRHFRQANRDLGDRNIGADLDLRNRIAEDFQIAVQRRGIEQQRIAVVRGLLELGRAPVDPLWFG